MRLWTNPRLPRPAKPDLRVLYWQECEFWDRVAANRVLVDRPRAEAVATQLYAMAGAEPPRFLWCNSPPAFFEALFWARERQPGRELWEDLSQAWQSLFGILDELFAAEHQTLREKPGTLSTPDRNSLRALENGPLLPALEQELRLRLPRLNFVAPPASLITTFRAVFSLAPSYAELAHGQVYEAAGLSLPTRMRTRLHLWRELAQRCGWWWPCEAVCLFCARPTAIRVDAWQRLHSERGPALEFPDGWKVYAWNGVLAREDIIERPESLTQEQIEQEPNLELRRVMIERFGEKRFLEEDGARIVHIDSCGTLYRREVVGQEPVVMVRVINSTPEPDQTFKIYRLRVPPWIRTAKEGVAWTFGLTEADYEPERQT